MSKYGWTKGTGLGADESGIINPLRVQVEKRKKKSDADGGGWAEPGSRGKIIGGKRKEEDGGKFGAMSEVIVLQNMLENLPDLQAEIAEGLGQEIGEECGEKVRLMLHCEVVSKTNTMQYGRVERLYIEESSRQVFIKFTSQVSALRVRDSFLRPLVRIANFFRLSMSWMVEFSMATPLCQSFTIPRNLSAAFTAKTFGQITYGVCIQVRCLTKIQWAVGALHEHGRYPE